MEKSFEMLTGTICAVRHQYISDCNSVQCLLHHSFDMEKLNFDSEQIPEQGEG